MNELDCSNSIIIFRIICWIATFVLLGYWIYLYFLDDDICLVDYKKYYDIPDYNFPVLSLCIKNPFSLSTLKRQNPSVDIETFAKFLSGEYFSPELLKVNYSDVAHDFSKYVTQYWIRWRNGRSKTVSVRDDSKFLIPSFRGFWTDEFYSCYSLEIPHQKNISGFFVLLNNTVVYPSGRRSGNYDTLVLIHETNQLLISGESIKNSFPKRERKKTYSMDFGIKEVERIRRRNKLFQPCNENWRNFDYDILQDHAQSVGCTPPYYSNIKNIPSCTTQEQIRKSMFTLQLDDYGKFPPCQGIHRVDYRFDETDLDGTEWSGSGEFWIGLYINNQKFKDVVQRQAIDLNGLIGYIGGYTGLILGYNILQIPDYILVLKWKMQNICRHNSLNG